MQALTNNYVRSLAERTGHESLIAALREGVDESKQAQIELLNLVRSAKLKLYLIFTNPKNLPFDLATLAKNASVLEYLRVHTACRIVSSEQGKDSLKKFDSGFAALATSAILKAITDELGELDHESLGYFSRQVNGFFTEFAKACKAHYQEAGVDANKVLAEVQSSQVMKDFQIQLMIKQSLKPLIDRLDHVLNLAKERLQHHKNCNPLTTARSFKKQVRKLAKGAGKLVGHKPTYQSKDEVSLSIDTAITNLAKAYAALLKDFTIPAMFTRLINSFNEAVGVLDAYHAKAAKSIDEALENFNEKLWSEKLKQQTSAPDIKTYFQQKMDGLAEQLVKNPASTVGGGAEKVTAVSAGFKASASGRTLCAAGAADTGVVRVEQDPVVGAEASSSHIPGL